MSLLHYTRKYALSLIAILLTLAIQAQPVKETSPQSFVNQVQRLLVVKNLGIPTLATPPLLRPSQLPTGGVDTVGQVIFSRSNQVLYIYVGGDLWVPSGGAGSTYVDGLGMNLIGNVFHLDTAFLNTLYPQLTKGYSNPTWITSLDWSKITNAPSIVTGNVVSELTGTVDQVYVNGGIAPQFGTATLSLPQSIGLTSQPIFGGLSIRGPTTTERGINLQSGTSQRWYVGTTGTAESGLNAGSDFKIAAYSDAGTVLATQFSLERSTGDATFVGTLTALANPNTSNSFKLLAQDQATGVFETITPSQLGSLVSGDYIDSLWKSNDSIFVRKSNVATFAYKDSTGIAYIGNMNGAGQTLVVNGIPGKSYNIKRIAPGWGIGVSATDSSVVIAADTSAGKLATQWYVLQNSPPTNLGNTPNATTVTVTSSTGTSTILPAATQTLAGVMTAADKIRLDNMRDSTLFGNGLTDSLNKGKLGGQVYENTTLSMGTNYLFLESIEGAALGATLQVISPKQAIVGNSTGFYIGVEGKSVDGPGIYGTSVNSTGTVGTSTNGPGVSADRFNPGTNDIATALEVTRMNNSGQTPANNYGTSIGFKIQTNNDIPGGISTYYSNHIVSKWSNASEANQVSRMVFTGVDAGVMDSLMALQGNGDVFLKKYGAGNKIEASVYRLGVTANGKIVEDNSTYFSSSDTSALLAPYFNQASRSGDSILFYNDGVRLAGVHAPAVTADNGLTKTGNNIQLGGALTKSTTIDGATSGDWDFTLDAHQTYIRVARELGFGKASGSNDSTYLLNALPTVLSPYTTPGALATFNLPKSATNAIVPDLSQNTLLNVKRWGADKEGLILNLRNNNSTGFTLTLGEATFHDDQGNAITVLDRGFYQFMWDGSKYIKLSGGSSGGSLTADNGVSINSGVIELGGTLTKPTTIQGDQTFTLLGSTVTLAGTDVTIGGKSGLGDSARTQIINGVFIDGYFNNSTDTTNRIIGRSYSTWIASGVLLSDKTLTLPIMGSNKAGHIKRILATGGGSFNWSFAGATVQEPTGTPITTLNYNEWYILAWDGEKYIRQAGGSSGTVATPTLQQVLNAGSTLTESETIATGANTLSVSGTSPAYIFGVAGGGGGAAINAGTETTVTNTPIKVNQYYAMSSGTVANNFGGYDEYLAETSSFIYKPAAKLTWQWQNINDTYRTSQFYFTGVKQGAESTFFRVDSVRGYLHNDTIGTQAWVRSQGYVAANLYTSNGALTSPRSIDMNAQNFSITDLGDDAAEFVVTIRKANSLYGSTSTLGIDTTYIELSTGNSVLGTKAGIVFQPGYVSIFSGDSIQINQSRVSSDTTIYKPFGIADNGTIARMTYWPGSGSGGGSSTLDGLSDVILTTPTTGQVLKFDGTNWINDTDASSPIIPDNEIVVGTGTGLESTSSFTWNGILLIAKQNGGVILDADSSPGIFLGGSAVTPTTNHYLRLTASAGVNQFDNATRDLIITHNSAANVRMKIFAATGNIAIGGETDNGFKTEIVGTVKATQFRANASASPSATVYPVDIQNSSGSTPLLRVNENGHVNWGGSTSNFLSSNNLYFGGSTSSIRSQVSGNSATNNIIVTTAGTHTPSAGELNVLSISTGGLGYAPTTGDANFAYLKIGHTINQTGTATGAVRGIYYNPTVTSVLGEHIAYEATSGEVRLGVLAGTGTRVALATSTGILSQLTNGTDGQVLKLVGGTPTWAAESGGGGSETDPVWIADSSDYYTKLNLQTSGSSLVHWGNLTNVPDIIFTNGPTDNAQDSLLVTIPGVGGDTVKVKSLKFTGVNGINVTRNPTATSLEITLDGSSLAFPSLSPGSVVFEGASGPTEDNTNFFWDNTNKRLGIGINAPTTRLHVRTSDYDKLLLDDATTNGYTQARLTNSTKSLVFGQAGSGITPSGYLKASGAYYVGNGAGGVSVAATDAAGDLRFYTGGTADANERMHIGQDGKLYVYAPLPNNVRDSVLTINPTTREIEVMVAPTGGGGGITSGTYASRPASPTVGQQYYQTDILKGVYTWNGNRWVFATDADVIAYGPMMGVTTPFQVNVSGTGANQYANSERMSSWRVDLGTTTTGNGRIHLGTSLATVTAAMPTSGQLILSYEGVYTNSLSTAAQAYIIRAGRGATGDGSGIFFKYTHSINSGQWQCITHDGTTATTTNTTVAVTQDVEQDLTIVYDFDGTDNVKFYIDNVLVATHTTNLPATFASSSYPFAIGAEKTAGTTSRMFSVDNIIIKQTVQ